MIDPDCHPPASPSPRERAKHLIQKVLGVKRVAGWLGVAEDTIYQGLSRGTEEHPVPASWVARIVRGAAAEGLEAPLDVLMPALAEAQP